MSKIAVIYWSQTGNTEMMANAIAEGIREAGAECDVLSVPAVSADQAAEYEMRDWVQRTQDANANLYQEQGLMINETPDEDGLEQCREFGRGFAKY